MSAGVAPIVNLKECLTHTPPPSGNKAAQSGFETQRRHHQKFKTGVSVAPQKELMSSKILFKKQNIFIILERDEVGSLTTHAFWIGANDTNGDNTIRYLGDGGAIIPDDSPVWLLQPRHFFEGINHDCVEVTSWKFLLSPCHMEKDFVCERYQ